MNFNISTFAIISLLLFPTVYCLGMLGLADVDVKSVKSCSEESNTGLSLTIAIRKVNRTTLLFEFHLETEHEIGAKTQLYLEGCQNRDGGCKTDYVYTKPNICESLKQLLGANFLELLNLAGIEDCPIKPGKYHVPAYYFNNKNFKTPQMYGEYKMMMRAENLEGQVWECYEFFYTMSPKQNK